MVYKESHADTRVRYLQKIKKNEFLKPLFHALWEFVLFFLSGKLG